MWIKRFEKDTVRKVKKFIFLCKECNQSWTCKENLEAHLRKFHPGLEGELKVNSSQNGQEIKIMFVKKRLHVAKRSENDTEYLASKFLKLN